MGASCCSKFTGSNGPQRRSQESVLQVPGMRKSEVKTRGMSLEMAAAAARLSDPAESFHDEKTRSSTSVKASDDESAKPLDDLDVAAPEESPEELTERTSIASEVPSMKHKNAISDTVDDSGAGSQTLQQRLTARIRGSLASLSWAPRNVASSRDSETLIPRNWRSRGASVASGISVADSGREGRLEKLKKNMASSLGRQGKPLGTGETMATAKTTTGADKKPVATDRKARFKAFMNRGGARLKDPEEKMDKNKARPTATTTRSMVNLKTQFDIEDVATEECHSDVESEDVQMAAQQEDAARNTESNAQQPTEG